MFGVSVVNFTGSVTTKYVLVIILVLSNII